MKETSDNYPKIVAMLDDGRRVVECAAGMQWVLQKRRSKGPDRWEGQSFCRTKEALLRLAGQHEKLLALPDRFQEVVKARRETDNPQNRLP